MGGGGSDLFVLALPMANDMPMVTLITFIGGFSAAIPPDPDIMNSTNKKPVKTG